MEVDYTGQFSRKCEKKENPWEDGKDLGVWESVDMRNCTITTNTGGVKESVIDPDLVNGLKEFWFADPDDHIWSGNTFSGRSLWPCNLSLTVDDNGQLRMAGEKKRNEREYKNRKFGYSCEESNSRQWTIDYCYLRGISNIDASGNGYLNYVTLENNKEDGKARIYSDESNEFIKFKMIVIDK